jgi:hypothetical protein
MWSTKLLFNTYYWPVLFAFGFFNAAYTLSSIKFVTHYFFKLLLPLTIIANIGLDFYPLYSAVRLLNS